jgi:hypothetical protein
MDREKIQEKIDKLYAPMERAERWLDRHMQFKSKLDDQTRDDPLRTFIIVPCCTASIACRSIATIPDRVRFRRNKLRWENLCLLDSLMGFTEGESLEEFKDLEQYPLEMRERAFDNATRFVVPDSGQYMGVPLDAKRVARDVRAYLMNRNAS